MIIIGARGFAKEILEICVQNNITNNLCFYDDINLDVPDLLFQQFPILKTEEEAIKHFNEYDNRFTIGIGNPQLRSLLSERFSKMGGGISSTISLKSDIGSYGIKIGKGANILDGVKISNDVQIGIAPLIYYNAIITHDCSIGNYVEISPNATILGRVKIGNFVHIGANATILPDIQIGDYVTIGAGSVVTKNIPNACVVAGVPARIIKTRDMP